MRSRWEEIARRLQAEEQHVDDEDPLKPVLQAVAFMQEYAIPLLSGLVLALFLANLTPSWYQYYFGSAHGPDSANAFDNSRSYTMANSTGYHRRLAAAAADVFKLSSCDVWGHDFTLHFFSNDVSACQLCYTCSRCVCSLGDYGLSLCPRNQGNNGSAPARRLS